MRSMTGFGQAEGESASIAFTVVVRGVNHRNLDVSLRLREEAKPSEAAVRELVSQHAERGRVELSVEQRRAGERPVTLAINHAAVTALHAASRELEERGLLSGALAFGDLLRLNDVVRVQYEDQEWSTEDHALLLDTTGRALAQFAASRASEGSRLGVVLEERLQTLADLQAALAERRGGAVEEMRLAQRRRLSELLEGREADPMRLEQELALMVDRSDVSEELDRLAAHLQHFREILASPGAIGKRLDFLSQEIFRELNTLGSKCRDLAMTRAVLDAKVVCEQLREQVQNVE